MNQKPISRNVAAQKFVITSVAVPQERRSFIGRLLEKVFKEKIDLRNETDVGRIARLTNLLKERKAQRKLHLLTVKIVYLSKVGRENVQELQAVLGCSDDAANSIARSIGMKKSKESKDWHLLDGPSKLTITLCKTNYGKWTLKMPLNTHVSKEELRSLVVT